MGQDFLAKRRVTLGRAVLQRSLRRARVGQDLVERRLNFGGRQSLWIDKPGGETDQAGVFDGLLHEVADRLLAGVMRPLRQMERHVAHDSSTNTKNPGCFPGLTMLNVMAFPRVSR